MEHLTRRLLLRALVVIMAIIAILVWDDVRRLWWSVTSTCPKVWSVDDMAALSAGQWERGAVYDREYWCEVSYGLRDAKTYTAFFRIKKRGESEARWTKEATGIEKVPDVPGAELGLEPRYHRRTLVIRRPEGAIKLELDENTFTDGHLRQAAVALKDRFAEVDAFLAE